MELSHKIGQKPMIAAVRHLSDAEKALESGVDNLFFMGGNVKDLIHVVRETSDAGKGAFIHLDLIRGLSSTDKESVAFVAEYIGADGIITPKSHLIKEAKKVGLYSILHFFVLDSLALENSLKLAKTVRPDGIEIMPGIIDKVVSRFAEDLTDIPVIASGLIETKQEISTILQAGATSLSVSDSNLWSLTFNEVVESD
ncbi:glycerol-3-phosphate responsive antiterminator [Gracilibacillus sp. YIM 98692]|uniref:glycerol-3-phosphate responsive antiterminator n=1 Tax=Gracilibacillus sp. YIM 98692 TaxID=2663532 RepID=UPI0013D4DF0B|nr:glycerol-3-phosphate responsive antiterminator [Gracilibacillus sp. YIM 98692]